MPGFSPMAGVRGGSLVDDDVKVLLIEDDAAAAAMYRLGLTADGYTVLIGCDGEEGLRMASE